MSSQKRNKADISTILFVFEVFLVIVLFINRIQFALIQFDDCSESIIGSVYSTEKFISANMEYYPVYKFEVKGKEYFHKRLYSSDSITWKNGESVKMKYNPSNPKQAYTLEEIKSHKSRAIWGIAGSVAVAFLVFGAILISYRSWGKRR